MKNQTIQLNSVEADNIKNTLGIIDEAYVSSSERENKYVLVESFYQNLVTLTTRQINYIKEYIKGNPWERSFNKMLAEYDNR